MNQIESLRKKEVLRFFLDICALPHGSGNTSAVADYCVDFAKQHNLFYIKDSVGNVIIRKDGKTNAEPVILQAHMDMVCVKNPGVEHDFTKDGLSLRTDGEYLFADGTTLGADDGIGVAMILEILADDESCYPPIEAVFTVDEETSMVGASGLDTSVLKGKKLLNLDSELTGIYWVSCAGGVRAEARLPMQCTPCDAPTISVTLGGLLGGHSGTEIDKNRTNAVRALCAILSEDPSLRLVSMQGGKVDNAIPDSCTAVCVADTESIQSAFNKLKASVITSEPNIYLEISDAPSVQSACTQESTASFLRFVAELPDGVQSMSSHFDGLVETSLNLGRCMVGTEEAILHWSVRSNVDEKRKNVIDSMQSIANSFGAELTTSGAYPAWEYKEDSTLRDVVRQADMAITGTVPEFQAIHAGLECGIFSGKMPGLDCISMGPTIHDIHSPLERLDLKGTETSFSVLCEILKKLA